MNLCIHIVLKLSRLPSNLIPLSPSFDEKITFFAVTSYSLTIPFGNLPNRIEMSNRAAAKQMFSTEKLGSTVELTLVQCEMAIRLWVCIKVMLKTIFGVRQKDSIGLIATASVLDQFIRWIWLIWSEIYTEEQFLACFFSHTSQRLQLSSAKPSQSSWRHQVMQKEHLSTDATSMSYKWTFSDSSLSLACSHGKVSLKYAFAAGAKMFIYGLICTLPLT